MANYITAFANEADYEAAKENLNYPNVTLIDADGSLIYKKVKPPHDYSKDFLTMNIATGGDIKFSGSTTANTLSYSKDNGQTWATADSATTISVNVGDKVLWKGAPTPQTSYPTYGIGKFSGDTDVRYSVEGNAMSLLFGDNFNGQTSLSGKDYALGYLFSDNTNVTSAENLSLPATTLAISCYDSMFQGCTNLTTAPELPATTLIDRCYRSMFFGCSSLTTAPELPATTLAGECYGYMFQGCTNLKLIKAMFLTTPSVSFTRSWVEGLGTGGTFIKNSEATWTTTGPNGIPYGWTVQYA